MKLKYIVEINSNLWIPLSSHISSHNNRKPWCTSFVMGPEGSPFYSIMKRGRSDGASRRAAMGHFSKGRAIGEASAGMSATLPDSE